MRAPRWLGTTPSGQHHEVGILLACCVAALEGWQVTYLGPNLPALEIAAAARDSGASAVGLSIVYPEADPGLEVELRALRRELGPGTPIVIGGRAADAFGAVCDEIHAERPGDLQALRRALIGLQNRGARAESGDQRAEQA